MSHPCEELCYIKFEKEKIINPSIFSLIIFLNFPLGIIQERIKDFPGYQSQRGESAYYSTKFSHKLHENGENWAEVGRGGLKICLCRSATVIIVNALMPLWT